MGFTQVFKKRSIEKGEWVQKIHDVASKMMKTWSADILKAWQKVWIRSYRMMVQQNKELAMQKTSSF
jgi:hypothetical protein